QYRSPEQRRAMEHVVNGAGQVLAILRTSEGKSLLYLLPCQLPGAGTTVLILPLVVLKEEMQRRCAEAGIEAHVWEPRSSPDQLHSCPLIIVAVEQAVRPRFRAFLNRLSVANELDRVVFDECHLAVTALGYRPTMGLLPLLRELECQMVFLTGTMPPTLVPQFEQAMLLQGARMVRSRTTRQDIYFGVTQCPPNQQFTQEFVIPGIRSLIADMEPGTRAIIYCWRKDVAEEVAGAIQAPVYHSTSGGVEEKAAVLQSWRDGDPVYIVATSAFGLGIDHPAVRWVVHVGVPASMIDFAQEVGRLGRDGAGGQSLVLVPPQWRATVNDRDGRPLGAAEAAMQTYIQTTYCRVQVLAQFLDGDDGHGCIDDRLTCDHCRDAGTVQIHENPSPAARAQVLEGPGEDDTQDLQAGAQLLHAQVQAQAQGLAEYISLLQTWRGVCMICYHLPRAASGAESHARHSLETCPNPKRFQYFDVKKQAQAEGRRRGGWFRQFNSCYRCFNPQAICDQQGQGQCVFKDIVMPACWAVFQKPGLAQQYLQELGGQHVGHDQGAYMLWLGEGRTVFGEEGTNAVAIAGLVLQQMGTI
ncbi:P-loop containing nucleoside triphosphate hydrolase protein, partial [Aspergillus aurantiobrunneus]